MGVCFPTCSIQGQKHQEVERKMKEKERERIKKGESINRHSARGAASGASQSWQYSTWWNSLWRQCLHLKVRRAKGEGSTRNIGRLGGRRIIENRMVKMGRLLKGRQMDREWQRLTQSNRETHFPLSFPLLRVYYETAPAVHLPVLLRLSLASHREL